MRLGKKGRRLKTKQTKVKIQRAYEDTHEITREAVTKAGLRGKKQIFIKPNMSHPQYVPGVITSPSLIREVTSLLRDGNSRVMVGESNGFNYPCWTAFENTGIENAVKEAGGSVINLSEDKLVRVKIEDGIAVQKLFLPKTLLESDAIVDLALMKTHEFAAYSGAIKNLFGCVPSNKRIYLHPYLSEVFYNLYTILKPQLTIMDARVALEGNGPTKGNPVKMDLMLTGNDAFSVDVVASEIMGLRLRDVGYLNYIARRTGFREDAITVENLQISEVTRKFDPPRIDLPVRAQMEIYKHEYLTKALFCQLGIVKLFQRITKAYRGEAVEVG